MTGDTDLVSTVETTKKLLQNKKAGVAFPHKRANGHFKTVADFTFKISVDSYRNHQFPDPIQLPDGKILPKPTRW
jgi:hypothetical protein